MIDNIGVKNDLGEIADKINYSDEKAAARLRALGDAVGGGPHADAWATTDIHRMIETDAIVERYKRQQKPDKIVAWLELARNTLIFGPLIVTWYGISQAVSAYHDLIGKDPGQANLPFLYLWQGGFGNQLSPLQSLSSLATIDFLILGFVFLATFVISYMVSLGREKREQEAEDLRAMLIDTLARATLCLHTRTWGQPQNFVDRFNRVTEQFKDVVGQLIQQMKQERTLLSELAERQKQEAQTFMSFKAELFSNMNTVSTSVKEMQESNRVLSGTINALVGPAQEVSRQQNTLMKSAQEAVKLLNEHVADQKRVVEQQELWGKELQNTLNTLNSSTKQSDALVSGISDFTEQQKGLLEAIKKEREQQVQMANRMLTTAENLKKAVEQVNQCLIEWQAINVNMYYLMQRVQPAARKQV